jgi:hypothetical protein
MNWFEIIKGPTQVSRKWAKWKEELAELGVSLVEECEGPDCVKTEILHGNTFQIVARHDRTGEQVVFGWQREEKRGHRKAESLKKKVRQAFVDAGIDITGHGLKIQGKRRRA